MKRTMCTLAGCMLSLSSMAGSMGASSNEASTPWSIIGSLGYTWYNDFYNGGPGSDPLAQAAIGDGQTALGRFAIARDFGVVKTVHLGAEIGVQNGNTARLAIPQETIDAFGGILPQVTIKPMLDLLATATWQPIERLGVIGIIKPGIAYRRMQVNDRVTFNDLSEVAFELQAGLGMHLSEKALVSLNYQGIFSGNTTYTLNTITNTGHISNIPTQNGLLLSLSYTL